MKKAVILGSGLSILNGVEPLESIPYASIPSWPVGKVKGHKGVLDKYEDLWVLRGRAHIYEGISWEQACFPTKYLAENGIEELIITNAAGGINPDFEIGDLMQIKGYLNFMKPDNSCRLSRLTQSVSNIETKDISDEEVKQASTEDEITLHKGVYVGVHGPNYETHAEVALFREMGADAVGMSTIPELETANEHGLKVTAISVITNVYGKTLDLGHEGVVEVAKEASKKLVKLLGLE